MSVERVEFPDGDLLVAEVSPSLLPPVRYRGRVFVRIGPRRDIASEAEERILTERRMAYMATFDATPCLGATLDDLNLEYIKNEYLPSVVTPNETSRSNWLRSVCMTAFMVALHTQPSSCLEKILAIIYQGHTFSLCALQARLLVERC